MTKNYRIIDFLVLFLVIMLGITFWFRGDVLAIHYSDISFHMANARGFIRAGGPVTWNFWEALPLGRANNYPPIWHIYLADLLKLGIPYDIVTKIAPISVICGGILIWYFGLKKLFNPYVAFFSSIFLIFSMRFISLSAMILPATLAVFCIPWLVVFFTKKQWIRFGALFVGLLYWHMIIPHIIALGLMVFTSIFYRKGEYLKPLIKTFSLSYFLYLPWLIPIIFRGKQYVKYLDTNFASNNNASLIWYLDIILWLLFIAGVILLIHKKQKDSNNAYWLFIILTIIFLPISYFFSSRGVNGHFFVTGTVIAGYFLNQILEKRKTIFFIPIVIIIIFFASFYVRISGYHEPLQVFWEKSSLVTMVTTKDTNSAMAKTYPDIVALLKQEIAPGEGLAVLTDYFKSSSIPITQQIHVANYFASRIDRPVYNLRQPEVFTRPYTDFTQARILLTNKDIDNLSPQQYSISEENRVAFLKQLKDSFVLKTAIPIDLGSDLYIYRNINDNLTKEAVHKSYFPFWLVNSLLIGLLLIICNFIHRSLLLKLIKRKTNI